MSRSRLFATLLVTSLFTLSGAAACGGAAPAKPTAAHATGAPATTVAEPSPTVTDSSPTSAPPTTTSPTPTGKATPKPGVSSSTTRAPEGAFTVRPPGGGHGAAGSESRTGGTAVALTFDDGPDPINTPKILEVLRKNGVKATFCLVGFRVRDNPEIVRQIVADGHTLCNHSWQHLIDLAKRDAGYIDWDLTHTNDAIHAAVGNDVPIKYFRAPGGNFTPELVDKASSMGMKSIYWDVDPKDWDHSKDSSDAVHTSRVVAEVKHQVRQGSIILSHDNKQPDTIVAYETLVPFLKQYFTLEALPV